MTAGQDTSDVLDRAMAAARAHHGHGDDGQPCRWCLSRAVGMLRFHASEMDVLFRVILKAVNDPDADTMFQIVTGVGPVAADAADRAEGK